MSYYYGPIRSNNHSTRNLAILFIVLIAYLQILSIADRKSNGMINISGNYVYNEDTYIIYHEYKTGSHNTQHSYEVYMDKDGHRCRYDPSTGNWIAFIETEEGMKDVGISKYGDTQIYGTEEY